MNYFTVRKEQINGTSLHGRQERAVYTEQYCGRMCRNQAQTFEDFAK